MLALLVVKTRWGFLADKAFAPFLGKPSRNAGFVFGVVSHSFGTAGRKAWFAHHTGWKPTQVFKYQPLWKEDRDDKI
jgi:hypothetical protein